VTRSIWLLLFAVGCKRGPVTCGELAIEHESAPSKMPTSFDRDVATATFTKCDDRHVYVARCRHGSTSTKCECSIDGKTKLEVKRDGRLPDERAAATAFVAATCEWKLR
jgi:hypothetical protein